MQNTIMHWQKKGLIYGAHCENEWMHNSALQPTPILINDKIRVFVGFRDKNGVGRVGYVDVNAMNPSEIIKVSSVPSLDIGDPGCFDDNGVVPCSVVRREDGSILLFYAGYNIGYHVRMTIFSGLAISYDNGETFQRVSKVPYMERTSNETLFRVIHTALPDINGWKFYYGAGNHFIQGKKKTLPVYDIRLVISPMQDAIREEGIKILGTCGDEYRIARPYVIKSSDSLYKMFFCKGTENVTYRLSYAESVDGINWKRMDEKLNLDLSADGWDGEMMAYPAVVEYKGKTYLFYNGNNYGYDGFGYAELLNE